MNQTHTKSHKGRIYLPTFALNFLPVVMYFAFMILLLIILIVFIQDGDWSWHSIKMHLCLQVFSLGHYTCFGGSHIS